MNRLRPYAKALVGFVAPGATVLIAAVAPGSDGGTAVTAAEAITAACTCLVTAGAVYAVPNRS